MKHLFYFFTIMPILWEIVNIVDVKRTHIFYKSINVFGLGEVPLLET